jgi:hypothetical protein
MNGNFDERHYGISVGIRPHRHPIMTAFKAVEKRPAMTATF